MTNEIIATKEMSLEELYGAASDIQLLCHDEIIDDIARRTMFDASPGPLLSLFSDSEEQKAFPMTEWALGLLCAKIGVPAGFIQKCIRYGMPDLASQNMNRFIKKMPAQRELMFRICAGRIRSVVSSRFVRLDAPEVLEVVMDTLDTNLWVLKGFVLNEERLHLRLVSRIPLNVKNEDLYPMILIDSSDVGRCSVKVTFGIFKLVCTNGLMMAKAKALLYMQRHIGISKDELRCGLIAGTQRINSLRESAVRMIAHAQSIPMLIQKDDEIFFEKLKRATGFADHQAERVYELTNERYGQTQWGFINAITEVAQQFPLDKRLQIESYAGSILAA